MAFTSGSAANYNQLLEDLDAWLVATVGWTQEQFTTTPQSWASAVVIVGGGTGYAVSDVLTVSGGTFATATMLTVTSVAAGVIDGIEVTEEGDYTVTPSNPVSATGGTGSGATFTMTWVLLPEQNLRASWKAPGNGTGVEMYLNVQTEYDVGDGFYSWKLFGATDYDSNEASDFGAMPGAGGPTYFNLWQNVISYWFYANDRRVIVIAKCSTNYMSMYGGFFLPFALPTEYPFPFALIASYPEIQKPDYNNARNSMIADPGADGAAWYRRRTTETWHEVENQASSTGSVLSASGQRAFIWPHKTGKTQGSGSGDVDFWSEYGFGGMKLNYLNETPLVQCHIIDLDDLTCVGALEGVYSTSGFGRTVEQTVTISSRTFRLFQRAFRNQAGDFFAVEEV